jgi:hypothetical protein
VVEGRPVGGRHLSIRSDCWRRRGRTDAAGEPEDRTKCQQDMFLLLGRQPDEDRVQLFECVGEDRTRRTVDGCLSRRWSEATLGWRGTAVGGAQDAGHVVI